jgi:hypothetical protein
VRAGARGAALHREKTMTHHPQMGSACVDNCLRTFTRVNANAMNHLAGTLKDKRFLAEVTEFE